MPFISRQSLDPRMRADSERTLKDELRKRLQDPTLTEDQRRQLHTQLKQVGKPRFYGTDNPSSPTAT